MDILEETISNAAAADRLYESSQKKSVRIRSLEHTLAIVDADLKEALKTIKSPAAIAWINNARVSLLEGRWTNA